MKDSIVTVKKLPESEAEYEQLKAASKLTYSTCCECEHAFSSANTHSEAGWRETQISGMCEDCFDNMFEE